jgi:hypothetical protein
MIEIMYSPEDVGKEVKNSHGKHTIIRKYHMTEKEKEIARNKWLVITAKINKRIVKQAGDLFYNPYRKGVYYYQIYSMFLLGANKWHSLNAVLKKMESIMSKIVVKKDGYQITAWDKFRGKGSRDSAIRCKDFVGRVQENMVFFQRLTRLHPYGYKLWQVGSAVDIKRVSRRGFVSGCYYYRLSTYGTSKEALPIRDYREFNFPQHERKYVSYKFIGTVITKDKVITEGKINEMSQMQSG